ncbi:MAG TPA: GNAT family N-acetyltransferase, partial [Terracidiphilus sp.]
LQSGDDTTAFKSLNEEWISKYFVLEEEDRKLLSDPEGVILHKGGHIFFAKRGETVVGCVALIPMGSGVYELGKMAVSPEMRGRGIGRLLLQHCIQESKRLGIRSLFLGSNKGLEDAVHLYESEGFKHVAREKMPAFYPYSRADVFMELPLS